jgi:tRNA(Ile)-lysidine synthase
MSQPYSPHFEAALAASWPTQTWCDVSVVLAVSGGADSVALACGLAKLKSSATGHGRLVVAHFNHRLRAEADDDATFVRSLAAQLELPFELDAADVAAAATKHGDGIEAAARAARYRFLRQTAERLGARYVVTAHTADDQIETILFNVLRGTGLSGLAGIPRARPLSDAVSVIRPMLNVRRCEVLAYLKTIEQSYRTDATNECRDFTRNRLRHELLPLLREQYQFDVDGSLLRLASIAGDAQSLIEEQARELLDRCVLPPKSTTDAAICLDVCPLQNQHHHLVREMFVTLWRQQNWPLQAMGFEQWDAVADLAQATAAPDLLPARKITLPGNVTVEIDPHEANRIILLPVPPSRQ